MAPKPQHVKNTIGSKKEESIICIPPVIANHKKSARIADPSPKSEDIQIYLKNLTYMSVNFKINLLLFINYGSFDFTFIN